MKTKVLILVVVMAVFGVFAIANAQESISQELDGIEVEEVTTVPSDFSLWWQNVTETVTLWLTFDPVAKAEKMIKFAEARIQIAELMSQSDQVKLQEKSQQMIERANQYMERIEAGKDKWNQKVEDGVNRLKKNIATHQIRREDFIDVIEENLSADQLGNLQDIREQGLENGNRLINAINNENLPEEIKSYLESVQARIQAHLEEVKEYNQERQQIREQIQNGNEEAVGELEQLKEQRREQIRERLINGEEIMEGIRTQLQNNLENQGDEMQIQEREQIRVQTNNEADDSDLDEDVNNEDNDGSDNQGNRNQTGRDN